MTNAPEALAETPCAVCRKAEGFESHVGSERIFGLDGEFPYNECRACGSLRLAEVPDLAPFYPAEYYSYGETVQSPLKHLLAKTLDRAALRFSWIPANFNIMLSLGSPLSREMSILDVGCGAGHFLRRLHDIGFTRLTGVDPFLSADREIAPGFVLYARELEDLDDRYDVITFHHSLEHIVDPEAALTTAAGLLKPFGRIVVRVPVVSYAWKRYNIYWAGLDAPRHITLFSADGLRTLAARAGLKLSRLRFDSTSFQFFASDHYTRGGLLMAVVPRRFTRRWFAWIIERARGLAFALVLNVAHQGDAAAFVFERLP